MSQGTSYIMRACRWKWYQFHSLLLLWLTKTLLQEKVKWFALHSIIPNPLLTSTCVVTVQWQMMVIIMTLIHSKSPRYPSDHRKMTLGEMFFESWNHAIQFSQGLYTNTYLLNKTILIISVLSYLKETFCIYHMMTSSINQTV